MKAVATTAPRVVANTRRKRFGTLRGWSLCAGLGLFVLWGLENFVGEHFELTTLLAYFPQHQWGIVPALCCALALRQRRYRLALWNGVALIFWIWALMALKWHPFATTKATVRVVTYNVALREGEADELAREIAHQKPDIICLQESVRTYPPQNAGENNVGVAISRHFPSWYMRNAGDTCILSRFPVRSSRDHYLRLTRRTLDVTLETPRGPLRVLSTHISTAFSGQAKYFGLRGQLREIIPNAQKAAQARLDQIKPLDRTLDADLNTPLILCGDFNTPPRGLFYRHLHSRLNDGFAQSGNGLGLTFPARAPMLRIDYVWTRKARATSVRVAPQGASDHRMVIADIEMP
ncbi:hypothetical protein IAD21_01827 [Abditibacteriota bacterium]|nr:hypothetical protein IAD21_01827 [Abditibacteriota bacterium]